MKSFMGLKGWEKVVIICIFGILTGAVIAYAAQLGAPTGESGAVWVAFPPENTLTLMTANTMGFVSGSQDIGFTATKLSVLTTWSGTAATNMASSILGSIDNSSFVTLVVNTMTASPNMYFQIDKPVRFVKGAYTSRSGGGAGSLMTMKVTGVR
jgi:hypothetical protein